MTLKNRFRGDEVSIALEIAMSPLRLPRFEIRSPMLLCYIRKEVFKTLTVLLEEDIFNP